MNTKIDAQELRVPAPHLRHPNKQSLKRSAEFPFLKLSAVAAAASVVLGLLLYNQPKGEPFDYEKLRCQIRVETPVKEVVEVVEATPSAAVRVKPQREKEVVAHVVERAELTVVAVKVTPKTPRLRVVTEKPEIEFEPIENEPSPFTLQVESYLARYKADEDERRGRTIIDAVKELPQHIADAGERTKQRIEKLIKPKQ